MEYVAVFLKLEHNWAGYIPEIPGCLATGKTEQEVVENLQDAFFTFNQLRSSPLPAPHAFTFRVTASAGPA